MRKNTRLAFNPINYNLKNLKKLLTIKRIAAKIDLKNNVY